MQFRNLKLIWLFNCNFNYKAIDLKSAYDESKVSKGNAPDQQLTSGYFAINIKLFLVLYSDRSSVKHEIQNN